MQLDKYSTVPPYDSAHPVNEIENGNEKVIKTKVNEMKSETKIET